MHAKLVLAGNSPTTMTESQAGSNLRTWKRKVQGNLDLEELTGTEVWPKHRFSHLEAKDTLEVTTKRDRRTLEVQDSTSFGVVAAAEQPRQQP